MALRNRGPILLLITAQGLDLLTFNPAHEQNPIVAHLGGPGPLLAKVFVICMTIAAADLLHRIGRHLSATRLITFATFVGALGAFSNL